MAQTAVVTSSSQGIGAAVAEAFAQAGYNVVVTYFKSKREAETVAERCRKHGVQVLLQHVDSTDERSLRQLADETTKTFGTVDVLVNNFGLADGEAHLPDVSMADVHSSLDNAFTATVVTTALFVPHLMRQPGGVVLNVSSIYGLPQSASVNFPLYSASKAAVINFTESCAKLYAPGIRCNAVAPGFTKTPHWENVDPARAKACIESTLLHEWVQPEDIAQALLFLARAPRITAQTIVVDAGWSKR